MGKVKKPELGNARLVGQVHFKEVKEKYKPLRHGVGAGDIDGFKFSVSLAVTGHYLIEFENHCFSISAQEFAEAAYELIRSKVALSVNNGRILKQVQNDGENKEGGGDDE